MANDQRPGLNVGALIQDGVALTTPEVLALLHEVCGSTGPAFPRTPYDLWITPAGELRSSPPAALPLPVVPRVAVAGLLDALLPRDDGDAERTVSEALRGLPARLRAATGDPGPQDLIDLRSILLWHLGGGEPRQIIRQLIRRAGQHPERSDRGRGGASRGQRTRRAPAGGPARRP